MVGWQDPDNNAVVALLMQCRHVFRGLTDHLDDNLDGVIWPFEMINTIGFFRLRGLSLPSGRRDHSHPLRSELGSRD